MKYFTLELNEKEHHLRMTGESIKEIEEKNNCSIGEYVLSNFTISKVTTLLRAFKKCDDDQFGLKAATALYDELIDAGYTIADIYKKIIYPACVPSGILSEEDLNIVLEAITKQTQTNKEKLKDSLNQ